MMMRLALILAATLALMPFAHAQDNVIARPLLRAQVNVSADIVRIGDFVENAGEAANIALFRAPDPGMTGTVPAAQILDVLRAHQVIGVDAQSIENVQVTRLSRTIDSRTVEQAVARAIAHRGGLGEAEDITIRFDSDLRDIQLPASESGELRLVRASYNAQTARFDASFTLTQRNGAMLQLRYTGTAMELVETVVLTHAVERGFTLGPSDIRIERRAKSEAAADWVNSKHAIGMATRRTMRAGQPLRDADLSKPELVQRNENITIIYESTGVYLTIRGKALEGGAMGDVVPVMNLQSKRTIQAVVSGFNQVTVSPAPRRVSQASTETQIAATASSRNVE